MHADEPGKADHVSAAGVQLAIDIGTRYVKIAYAGPDGVARLLPATAGGKPGLAPFFFHFPKDASKPIVGEDALRLLGRGDLIDFRKLAGAVVRLPDRITTPGALYVELFGYLRSRAQATVGDVTSDAPLLISVPPQLDQQSRNVLAQAAREAGFAGTDFIDLPVAIATAWASTTSNATRRGRILLIDVGACAVSWTLLDRQEDGGFRIDWTMPPGELRDHGAEDVEVDLLDHLSASLAPQVAQALRVTREVVQDELRRAKEQIAAGAKAVSLLVDRQDIRVDEQMIAKAASNLLDTVATFVANQLAEFKNTGQRRPMVLLAGGGASTPGLAARLGALDISVATWTGQATGGAIGALLLVRRPAWLELSKRERTAKRRRVMQLLAGLAYILALFLSCVALGWFSDEKGHTAALAAMRDGIPPPQAIATVEEYLSETYFRRAIASLTAPFTDITGQRAQTRAELANYTEGLANGGAAQLAAIEREFRWPPDSETPARLRSIGDDMRVLTAFASQSQLVGARSTLLANLADAALAAAAAQTGAAAAIPSDSELGRMGSADLEMLHVPMDRLTKQSAELAHMGSLLMNLPSAAGYHAFLADLDQTRSQLNFSIQRRLAAIVCSDAEAELAHPGSRSDYARIEADLAKLPADLCGGKVESLQPVFQAHERMRAELDQLHRDAAPLIEALNIPGLTELLGSRWPRAASVAGLQPWFGAWLDTTFAEAEDQALQRLPGRVRNRAEQAQIARDLGVFRDAEAGFGVFPYHRPSSIAQRIQTLQSELNRVQEVLSHGVTVRRIEFFPAAIDPSDKLGFTCKKYALFRRTFTISGETKQTIISLDVQRMINFFVEPEGFTCTDGTHATWERDDNFISQDYRIDVEGGGIAANSGIFTGVLHQPFKLSPDQIILLSDGEAVDIPLKYSYVLRLTGS
jgi:hypothetical protein